MLIEAIEFWQEQKKNVFITAKNRTFKTEKSASLSDLKIQWFFFLCAQSVFVCWDNCIGAQRFDEIKISKLAFLTLLWFWLSSLNWIDPTNLITFSTKRRGNVFGDIRWPFQYNWQAKLMHQNFWTWEMNDLHSFLFSL